MRIRLDVGLVLGDGKLERAGRGIWHHRKTSAPWTVEAYSVLPGFARTDARVSKPARRTWAGRSICNRFKGPCSADCITSISERRSLVVACDLPRPRNQPHRPCVRPRCDRHATPFQSPVKPEASRQVVRLARFRSGWDFCAPQVVAAVVGIAHGIVRDERCAIGLGEQRGIARKSQTLALVPQQNDAPERICRQPRGSAIIKRSKIV